MIQSMRALKAFWQLTKPRLTQLVVLTSLAGAAVAPGHFSGMKWLALLLASWGIVGSANAVNCYLEKDVDALMERTKLRPLVTGEIGSGLALGASLALATFSIWIFYVWTNPLTTILAFLGFALYVAVYTPLKRYSMAALFVGAIPGAIPPVFGWTAATGSIDTGAWVLFGILFFWQLPHFIAISMNRLPEYNNAGLKTVPGSLGGDWALRHMIVYSALLIATSILPYPMGLAGNTYLWTTGFMGLLFITLCVGGFFKLMEFNWNRVIFLGSLVYLPVILGFWVLDHWYTKV